jgi:rhodanese-related sulfurtransferase
LKKINSLSVDDFKSFAAQGFTLLDVREVYEFTNGFLPGSVFIGLGIQFEEWVKKLLSSKIPILLIAPAGKENEAFERLYKEGFEKIEGFLEGGYGAWESAGEKIDLIIDIEPDELAIDIPFDPNLTILDVRDYNEFAEGHVKGATSLPLAEMVDVAQIAGFEENQNIYIHSGSGYRSVIAASLLKKHGYHNLRNVTGGWSKIKKQKNIITEKDVTRLN